MTSHALNYRHALLLFPPTAGGRRRLGHGEKEIGRSEVSIFGNSCLFLSLPTSVCFVLLSCYCALFQLKVWIMEFSYVEIHHYLEIFSGYSRSSVGESVQMLYLRKSTNSTSSIINSISMWKTLKKVKGTQCLVI